LRVPETGQGRSEDAQGKAFGLSRVVPVEAETMVQKIIDIVGSSPRSFAEAAENAVTEAGKTVHDMKWGRVSEFEIELDGSKIKSYRTTVRIYFDVKR
jgi:flavin-binding protein dodecin